MATASSVEKFRLLIVEDQEHTANYMRQFLPCFTVESVVSFAAAMQRLSDSPPVHAVLLDLHLADRDGAAMVEEMCHAHPTMPVVAITGMTDVDPSEVLRAGAEELILKPLLIPSRLANTMKQAMVRHAIRIQMGPAEKALDRAAAAVDRQIETLSPPFGRKPKSDPNRVKSN